VVKGAFCSAPVLGWAAVPIAGLLGSVITRHPSLRPVMPRDGARWRPRDLHRALIFLDRFTIFNQYFTGGVDTVTNAEGGLGGIDINSPGGFTVAFAAGVIAFISPCCLPMVPAYLAHLAGVSADSIDERRGVTFRHSVAFVLGFSAVFVALGASVGAVGYVVRDNLPTIEKIAGVLLARSGSTCSASCHPWLYRTYQIELQRAGPRAAADLR
jgi:hypothetical protein